MCRESSEINTETWIIPKFIRSMSETKLGNLTSNGWLFLMRIQQRIFTRLRWTHQLWVSVFAQISSQPDTLTCSLFSSSCGTDFQQKFSLLNLSEIFVKCDKIVKNTRESASKAVWGYALKLIFPVASLFWQNLLFMIISYPKLLQLLIFKTEQQQSTSNVSRAASSKEKPRRLKTIGQVQPRMHLHRHA